MASLGLLLLSSALMHIAQTVPVTRSGGRGRDVSVGGDRQRRDLLPYEDQMMSYPALQGGGGTKDLFYQSDDWRGRSLDQALQRLVERDLKREHEEEQQAAYLAALLRLLSEAERAGLVGPGDVEVVEEEEDEEDDQGPPRNFQGSTPADYDETGRGMGVGGPPATWWGLLEPQVAQALLDRMEPQLVQTLLQRVRQQGGRLPLGKNREQDQDFLRHVVAKILANIGPNDVPVIASGRRMRRDLSTAAQPVSSAHRRSRRSLDDMGPPSPSNDPPLFRVKRLEDEDVEEKLRPPVAGLQRMKRIDTMATIAKEELNHGSRRRRKRAALNYDPQILIDQILQYMRE
ncbi:proprotein convertase subtilisin/kexin type 1 inhibitor, like [Mastacembelus armatus]|uniref:proprotein convertase subtilisin/kexin type 1 inhibitor, like n=1 Tax=Mastacembelus armatus TaxID=205130 RepID=UPI000E4629D7|nr:uncharacterized protein LOC113145891 [Mastacembelus armatus]